MNEEHKCWKDIEKCEKCKDIKEQSERDVRYAAMQYKMLKGIFDHSFFKPK